LKQLLMKEGASVNDAITGGDVVFAVVPTEKTSSQIHERVFKDRETRSSFVKSHLLVLHGSQPSDQKFGRGYKSLNGAKYVWPIDGERRLIHYDGGNNSTEPLIEGEAPTTYMLGSAEGAVINKHGKKVKPIYLGTDNVLRA
jgi:hypothetical protein